MFLIFRTRSELSLSSKTDGDRIILTPEESRHIKARRLPVGEIIGVGDGEGTRYKAAIADFRTVTLLNEEPVFRKENSVILYSALPEGKRLDFLVQKAVELMVRRLVFINCERSVREKLPLERLQRIAEEAAVQSQRFYLPRISGVYDLNPDSCKSMDWVSEYQGDFPASREEISLILHPYTEKNINIFSEKYSHSDGEPGTRAIRLFIGPEGGFTDRDISSVKKITEELAPSGTAETVSMGASVLRTETAGIAALAKFY